MELNTRVNGTNKVVRMEEEFRYGLMDRCMRDTGSPTKQTEEEDLFMQMEMFTTETGRMIRPMDMANITTLMELDTKVIGMKISNMVRVKKFGQIMLAMKASIKMVRNTEEVSSYGPMDQLTLVISSKITFTAWVFTRGQTEENTMDNGRITRWMVKECSLGQMAGNMKDNTLTIRRKDKESLHGLMDANMMVTGRTGNSMARVFTIQAKAKSRWVNGPKASASTGSMIGIRIEKV